MPTFVQLMCHGGLTNQSSEVWIVRMFRRLASVFIALAFLFNNMAGHTICVYCGKLTVMEVCFKFDQPSTPAEIVQALNNILNNQTIIMAAIDDLKAQTQSLQAQVNDLQTSLDNEQAQIAALLQTNASVVNDLNNQIAALQAQIANGATPEQLQDVANSLTNISQSIATTKADLEGTIADETPAPAPEA